MLQISNYGITLRKATDNDLEKMRHWRNSYHIACYMTFQGHITKQMQEEWWQRVQQANDLYLIIKYKGRGIGVTGAKLFNPETCETHGYIYDLAYQNSAVAYRSALCLYDYLFEWYNTLTCKIRKHNTRSIKFNRSLGFELAAGQENEGDQLYVLTRKRYEASTARFKKLLSE
jgi:UDP-4-amino-4,6-dideoxy-N-acetyl-beta-L-altrosamine N-acetyltransferase